MAMIYFVNDVRNSQLNPFRRPDFLRMRQL